MPWNSNDSTSPALSNALLNENSLITARHRNSNQNAPPHGLKDHSRSISPYYQVARPSAIGQGLNSKSPRKTYLDPTSGSFVTGQRSEGWSNNLGGFHGFNGEVGGREHLSTVSSNFDNEGTRNVRNNRQVFPNDSGFPATASGVASRSESIPPSRNGTDQPTSYNGLGVDNFLYTSFSQPPFHESVHRHTQSGHSSAFSSQPNNRAYDDIASHAQEAGISGDMGGLSLNGVTRQRPNNGFNESKSSQFSSQNPFPSGYINNPGNMRSAAEKRSLNRHGSFSPDSLPDGPFTEQLQGYRGSMLGERGSISPSGSDYRRSQHSPYYSTGGTPAPGNGLYYASSRGMQNHRGPPNGHPALLDRKLRGLQQEQQGFLHPHANLYMNQQFRGHFTNPYEYATHNEMAINPLTPYYALPPGIPPVASMLPPKGPAQDQDDGHNLRSALLEEFRSNSKTSRRYELKVSVSKTFTFLYPAC